MLAISELNDVFAKIYPSVEIAIVDGWWFFGGLGFSFSRHDAPKKGFESVEITSWHLTSPPMSALYLIYNPTIYLQTQNLNETIWNYLKCSVSIDLI